MDLAISVCIISDNAVADTEGSRVDDTTNRVRTEVIALFLAMVLLVITATPETLMRAPPDVAVFVVSVLSSILRPVPSLKQRQRGIPLRYHEPTGFDRKDISSIVDSATGCCCRVTIERTVSNGDIVSIVVDSATQVIIRRVAAEHAISDGDIVSVVVNDAAAQSIRRVVAEGAIGNVDVATVIVDDTTRLSDWLLLNEAPSMLVCRDCRSPRRNCCCDQW